jgi:flagella basal body P-ring formation protein FlgA
VIRIYRHRNSLCLSMVLVCFVGSLSVHGQQIPGWRDASSMEPNRIPTADIAVRIAIKDRFFTSKNLLVLSDIADISGDESTVSKLVDLPIGLAPASGKHYSWTQDELLQLLALRGLDAKQIRWAGANACQVSYQTSLSPEKKAEFTKSYQAPQVVSLAEKNVSAVILAYLQNKGPTATGWTIEPTVPSEHTKVLSQRHLIKGIIGGREPWTGRQLFTLLIQNSGGEATIDVEAEIQLPPLVIAASGPLAKGRILTEGDLKLVRLTPAMKTGFEECYEETQLIVGKELRRNISTGQPIQRTDTGPASLIHAKDFVRIRVVAGAVVAETSGRALQSGGTDELIQVEVSDSKKRLASRVIAPGLVEVISR